MLGHSIAPLCRDGGTRARGRSERVRDSRMMEPPVEKAGKLDKCGAMILADRRWKRADE